MSSYASQEQQDWQQQGVTTAVVGVVLNHVHTMDGVLLNHVHTMDGAACPLARCGGGPLCFPAFVKIWPTCVMATRMGDQNESAVATTEQQQQQKSRTPGGFQIMLQTDGEGVSIHQLSLESSNLSLQLSRGVLQLLKLCISILSCFPLLHHL